jgi:phage terminase large subunit-like protein
VTGGLANLARAVDQLQKRTVADPLAYWTPTAPQLQFLSDPSHMRLARAGNQVGKTTMGLVDCIYRCLGGHPYQPVRPAPIEAWVIVESWESSLSVQSKLWALLPKDALADDTEYTTGKGFRGRHPMVRFKNGSLIRVRTSNQGSLALAGSTIDYCMMDEPPPEEIYNEVVPRVLRNHGRIVFTLTPVGAPLGWLRKLVDDGRVKDFCFPLTVENTTPIGSRPLMSAEQIESFSEAILPQQRAQRVFGDWESLWTEGRVFRMFDPARHVKPEVPTGEAMIGIGIDHGTEAGAQVGLLVAMVRDGGEGQPRVWVLDQVQTDGQTTPDQDARMLLDMLKRAGLMWESVDLWVGDRRVYGRRNGSLKSNAMLMSAMERALRLPTGALPFRIRTAHKPAGSVFEGIRVLSAAMLRGDFFVHPRCKRLADDLQRWDGREASEHKHSIDALRYTLELVTRRMHTPTVVRLG